MTQKIYNAKNKQTHICKTKLNLGYLGIGMQ